jgi:hypothetical protein
MFTHIAPPNILSWSGAIHACSFVASFSFTIIYWAAFSTQKFVTIITHTNWQAIHACSFETTLTVTITYGAAFRTQYSIADITAACRNAVVTKNVVAFITKTHWITIVT